MARGVCARCRHAAGEGARWWQFRRYLTNTLTAVWLCAHCSAVRGDRCATCETRPALASIPLCVDCLIGYEGKAVPGGEALAFSRREQS